MRLKDSQILILKINTKHIKKKSKKLSLKFNEAMDNNEIISMGSSQFIRALERYCKKENMYEEVFNIGGDTNKTAFSYRDSKKYKLTNAIISVEISSHKFYDSLLEHPFYVNGIEYVEFIGTTGGVKNSTVFYIRKDLFNWAIERSDNGRNLGKQFIPSKLQAYKALDLSVSNPVSQPKKYAVVKDCIVNFKDSVIELDIDKDGLPTERIIEDYDIELNTNDGFGLISPRFAKQWAEDLGLDYTPSSFIIRNAYCKGALMVFDFVDFASKKNDHDYNIIDVWGNKSNVYDLDFILTESMLKLWDSYDGLSDYIYNCEKYDYQFSITKVQKNEVDEVRTLNYQFIQPLNLSDSDIEELCKPTVEVINKIVNDGWIEKVLFLRGMYMSSDNVGSYEDDFIKAVMIDEHMIYDPFVKSRINHMIEKTMTESKFGKLFVDGNFTILSGDPYALCQSIFGQEVTGLLSKGEIYSKHWIDKNEGEICVLRAPMTSENNIVKMRLNYNDECEYWYKYMEGCSIINTWDTTTHTINGADLMAELGSAL
jgi:hypothetical protein